MSLLYSRKCWQKLNLMIEPQIAIAMKHYRAKPSACCTNFAYKPEHAEQCC